MELVELPADHAPRIAASEAMGPIPMFQAYAASQELSQEATAAGQKILEVILHASYCSNLGFSILRVHSCVCNYIDRLLLEVNSRGMQLFHSIACVQHGSDGLLWRQATRGGQYVQFTCCMMVI